MRFFCIAFLLFSLGACAPQEDTGSESASPTAQAEQAPGPEAVVRAYLDAFVKKRDLQQAYALISKQDQEVKTQAQYAAEQARPEWAELLNEQSSFEIQSSEIKADSAVITAEVQSVDLKQVMEDILSERDPQQRGAAAQSEWAQLSEAELARYVESHRNPPMQTSTQTLHLRQEQGQWKIYHNWAAQKQSKGPDVSHFAIGEKAPLMSDERHGQVSVQVKSVKFIPIQASEKRAYCIVELAVQNQMKKKINESYGLPLSVAQIKASNERVYKRDLMFSPKDYGLIFLDVTQPLQPGQEVQGVIAFSVDKDAQNLILQLDTGYSPTSKDDYMEGQPLTAFQLGSVIL